MSSFTPLWRQRLSLWTLASLKPLPYAIVAVTDENLAIYVPQLLDPQDKAELSHRINEDLPTLVTLEFWTQYRYQHYCFKFCVIVMISALLFLTLSFYPLVVALLGIVYVVHVLFRGCTTHLLAQFEL